MLRTLTCLALLAATVAMAAAAGTFAEPLPWNWQADRQRCPVSDGAVWADYPQGEECIRYFIGGDVEGAPLAIVMLRGDRDFLMNLPPEEITANTAQEQQALADEAARRAGLPVLLVSRPGTYGSSGDHGHRRQESEFLALDAALDLLRARHGIGRLVLLGHSGGATAVAALLTLGRTDVACAVMTSGAFSLLERARMVREQNGMEPRPGLDLTGLPEPYDPLEHVDGIAHDPERTMILIGNLNDKVTPFSLQIKFARAVRRAGHKVRMATYPARPPKFHNLGDTIGLTVAARCARGEL